ncbi:hypothetical protein ACVBEQ_22370 [Nakamurella sp. GG22]
MRRLGWALFGLTCAMFVLQGALLAASTNSLISHKVLVDQAFPLVGLGAVIGAGIGVLIISRYPGNVIGWLFVVGQLGSIIGLAADAFTVLVAEGTVDAPLAGQICAYLKSMFDGTYTMVFLAIIFMIAPDGRPLSPRLRYAIALPIAALALRLAILFSQPASDLIPGAVTEPDGPIIALLLADVLMLLLSFSLGAVALVLRMRQASGPRRAQLRWILTSAVVVGIALLAYIVGALLAPPVPWVLAEMLYLAYIFVWVAVGVAILRYRLYDIDIILSRAIVLGVLAAFVTLGYIGVVVLISWLLTATGLPGASLYWPSLVATALVAAAFQPLRRHVLRLADQLVYGRRAAPYEALATLSRRLADSPSPDELPSRVAEAVGRAVGAEHVRVSVRRPGVCSLVTGAGWPAEPVPAGLPDPDLVLPIKDFDEVVGSIEITMPPGRTLRAGERRLIEDVSAQAGMAFRNALLEAELAARVAESERRSGELAASRRRLVGAEDEARARLADAIRRRVVPHLTAVDAELGRRPDVATVDLDRLIAETECALEELREVVRGVFPALLERRGLVPAVTSYLSSRPSTAHSSTGPVLEVDDAATGRLDPAVEAAGYAFVAEVSSAGPPRSIRLGVRDENLLISVDVAGDAANELRWQHARDRVAALDGEIRLNNDGGGGVQLQAVIPLPPDRRRDTTAAHSSASRSGPNDDLDT